jgi:TetR/AcrR family transcriptional regulator
VAKAAAEKGKGDELSPSASALLDAAARILSKRSAIDISLSDIAQESGMNSALVKYYFGSKDGLLLALQTRDGTKAVAEMEHLAAASMTPEAKLRIHISGAINTYYRAPYLNRLFHYLIDSGNRDAEEQIAKQFAHPIREAQRAIIDEGVRLGQFRPVDPEMLHFSLTGACDYIFSSSHALPALQNEPGVTDALRKRYIEHVTDIFLTSILINPPR